MDFNKEMNVISYYSDPLPSESVFSSKAVGECSSASDIGSSGARPASVSDGSSGARPASICSDDEVLLASRHPKKKGGRKKVRETRHPVYRGVRWRNSHTWVCEVREPNKKTRIWLGTFPTAEMAARAHDVAAIALRGRTACVNFADSLWRLPIPASLDPKDIQKAAAEGAEAFRPALEEDNDVSGDVAKPDEEEEEEEAAANATTMPEKVFYMDEEAVFGMPGLLASMAEGLMLPPPPHSGGGGDGDDVEVDADVSLWSFSI